MKIEIENKYKVSTLTDVELPEGKGIIDFRDVEFRNGKGNIEFDDGTNMIIEEDNPIPTIKISYNNGLEFVDMDRRLPRRIDIREFDSENYVNDSNPSLSFSNGR